MCVCDIPSIAFIKFLYHTSTVIIIYNNNIITHSHFELMCYIFFISLVTHMVSCTAKSSAKYSTSLVPMAGHHDSQFLSHTLKKMEEDEASTLQ